MRPGLLLLAICLATSPVEALWAQAGAKVTVYRCTDAAGRQTLRDTPCPAGQAHFGPAPIPDQRSVDASAVVKLHAAEKRHIQPAPHGQIKNVRQRQGRVRIFPQAASGA